MPQLTYQLKGVHDKHLSKLTNESNWEGLKDDVKSAQLQKKKGDISNVEIEIIVEENVGHLYISVPSDTIWF